MATLISRFKNAWNIIKNGDEVYKDNAAVYVSSVRPDRPRTKRHGERSIITSVYNRIATDCASIDIKHVIVDPNTGMLSKTVMDSLNDCFTFSANLDQTGRQMIYDAVYSAMDEGSVAVVPTVIDDKPSSNPEERDAIDIYELRVCKIQQWYPHSVLVNVYDEDSGKYEQRCVSKNHTMIFENPFYAVMNEPNSIFQRLIYKLNILDAIDEETKSGKLNMIVQLPYAIKTKSQKNQAEERRQLIEDQLVSSKYGIAYTDGTEKIIQLNRPLENNLMAQIEYLTSMFYDQLGIDKTIMSGTADDKTMNNYLHNVVEVILTAFVEEARRKFISTTARTQGHTIMFFRDPFKLIPISSLADIADRLSRNEIMTGNEIRSKIGLPPSSDPNADMLRNKNIAMSPDMEGMYNQTDPNAMQDENDSNDNSSMVDDQNTYNPA